MQDERRYSRSRTVCIFRRTRCLAITMQRSSTSRLDESSRRLHWLSTQLVCMTALIRFYCLCLRVRTIHVTYLSRRARDRHVVRACVHRFTQNSTYRCFDANLGEQQAMCHAERLTHWLVLVSVHGSTQKTSFNARRVRQSTLCIFCVPNFPCRYLESCRQDTDT